MKKSWYSMRALGNGVGELRIYGPVGDSWFEESVTPAQIWRELEAMGDVNLINVYINSPGGSVFDGMTIVNQLQRHPAKIHTYVEGLAASMASVIAICGDKRYMYDSAMIMIHNPTSGAYGEADYLRNIAAMLEKITDTAANMYVKKSGQELSTVLDMMKKETWMTGAEALALGFVDEMIETVAAAASLEAARGFDFNNYHNVPAALKGQTAKQTLNPKLNTRKETDMKATLLAALAAAISTVVGPQQTQDQIIAAIAKGAGVDPAMVLAAIGSPTAVTSLTEENIKALDAALKALPPQAAPAAVGPASLAQCKTLQEAYELGQRTEMNRIKGVQAQLVPGHDDLIAEMMFDGKTQPGDAAMRVLDAERAAMASGLEQRRAALKTVPARPPVDDAGGAQLAGVDLSKLSVEERAKSQWEADAELRSEFNSDYDAYLAFEKANGAKLVKVLKK